MGGELFFGFVYFVANGAGWAVAALRRRRPDQPKYAHRLGSRRRRGAGGLGPQSAEDVLGITLSGVRKGGKRLSLERAKNFTFADGFFRERRVTRFDESDFVNRSHVLKGYGDARVIGAMERCRKMGFVWSAVATMTGR